MAVPGADGQFGDATEPIAIVGLSCCFLGYVSSPQQFWEMLVNGRSGHCEVPADRFNASVWQHPDHSRKGAVSKSKCWKHTGAGISFQIQPISGFFLDQDVSLFDAPFFSITAKEAMGMDPMQRQLLEIAYECFENGELQI